MLVAPHRLGEAEPDTPAGSTLNWLSFKFMVSASGFVDYSWLKRRS